MVIATAALGQANALVTRDDDIKDDSDLKGILSAADIQVLSVRHFLAELDFVVNHQRLTQSFEASVDVQIGVSINPRHFTKQVSYSGVVRDVKVFEDTSSQQGPAVLWLHIEFFDPDTDTIFEDRLRLPEDSGRLMDFVEDLHRLGIDVNTPHDLVGLELPWEFRHGYSTEERGARLRRQPTKHHTSGGGSPLRAAPVLSQLAGGVNAAGGAIEHQAHHGLRVYEWQGRIPYVPHPTPPPQATK